MTDRAPKAGRVGPPTRGVPGTLYDFVRRYLSQHGGSCTRDDLLVAIRSSPVHCQRLDAGRGFAALMSNMYHSGDVLLEGNTVRASARALRRLANRP